MANKLRITWVKSAIGFEKSQRKTVHSLGLKKLNNTVEVNDTPQVRGMIEKIRHLLRVEEV
jgi:large subunit ribosomal protein L30